MQLDNQIAEITKKEFNNFIEHYKSRFESSLQKHLADYQREHEVFFSNKQNLINELFLDKKSEFLNAFEASVNSKSSLELNHFHKTLNESKNKILKEMREDQHLIVKDFTTAMKQFSSENRQKMGDYFVSEKTKFLYEVNKSRDKFKRDLEMINSEQLEKSLGELHDLIHKQRDLARSELDSLKIFKLKEFSSSLDELISKNDEQFKAELDINLKYFLNSFESKVKERADEVVNQSIVEIEENSQNTLNRFQEFSQRRLKELKDDFEEIVEESSSEHIQKNKEVLDGVLKSFVAGTTEQYNALTKQVERAFQKLEEDSIVTQEKTRKLFDEKISKEVDNKFNELEQRSNEKVSVLGREFEENIKNNSEKKQEAFLKHIEEESTTTRERIKRDLNETRNSLLLTSEKDFNNIVNQYVTRGSNELASSTQQLKKSVAKEMQENLTEMSLTLESETQERFTFLLEEFNTNINSSVGRIFLKLNSNFEEKKEILSEACVDLLQDAKCEIYNEFQEVKKVIINDIDEVRNDRLKNLSENIQAMFKRDLARLENKTSEIIKVKYLEFTDNIEKLQKEEQTRMNTLFSKLEQEVMNKERNFTKETQNISNKKLSEFKIELEAEIDNTIQISTETFKKKISGEMNVIDEHLKKKRLFLNEDLNKKIQLLKDNFEDIQRQEEERHISSLNRISKAFREKEASSLKESAKVIVSKSLEFTQAKLEKIESERAVAYSRNADSINQNHLTSLKNKSAETLTKSQEAFGKRLSDLSDAKVGEFESSIKLGVSKGTKLVDSLVNDFHSQLDKEFKTIYENKSFEFRKNIGGVYQKALGTADKKLEQNVAMVVQKTNESLKETATKSRHVIQAEVKKEVEKFGHKVESLSGFLLNKLKSDSRKNFEELQLIERKILNSLSEKVEGQSAKVIRDVEIKTNEFVKNAKMALNLEVNKIYKKEVDEIKSELKQVHDSISKNSKKESVDFAKSLLKNYSLRIEKLNRMHFQRYELMMQELDKKTRYIESVLHTTNPKLSRGVEVKTSKVRPPSIPTV